MPWLASESKATTLPRPDRLRGPAYWSAPTSVGATEMVRGGKRVAGPLRVLHVIDRFDVGGMELVLSKVIRGLGREGFAQRICTMRGFNVELQSRLEIEGQIDVVGSAEDRWQFSVGRLARIMRAVRPDIVHSRNWGAIEAIPAARLTGVPVVIHSEHGYEMNTIAGLPLRQRVVRRMFYAMADAVVAVTRELSAFHTRQAWVPTGRIRVIYNGVDTDLFAPRNDKRVLARESLGFPAGALVIGSVGRLTAIKDHATLLRATALLIRLGVDARVVLVGSGGERDSLESLVQESSDLRGRVAFIGATNRVPELLNALDAFVLPSLSEGLSNTLLEAMATGLPVVATRVGGNPEVLGEDQSGLLFAPGDAAGLSKLLVRLAGSTALRRETGALARQRVLDLFSLGGMFSAYRQLYTGLARQHGIAAEA